MSVQCFLTVLYRTATLVVCSCCSSCHHTTDCSKCYEPFQPIQRCEHTCDYYAPCASLCPLLRSHDTLRDTDWFRWLVEFAVVHHKMKWSIQVLHAPWAQFLNIKLVNGGLREQKNENRNKSNQLAKCLSILLGYKNSCVLFCGLIELLPLARQCKQIVYCPCLWPPVQKQNGWLT